MTDKSKIFRHVAAPNYTVPGSCVLLLNKSLAYAEERWKKNNFPEVGKGNVVRHSQAPMLERERVYNNVGG